MNEVDVENAVPTGEMTKSSGKIVQKLIKTFFSVISSERGELIPVDFCNTEIVKN